LQNIFGVIKSRRNKGNVTCIEVKHVCRLLVRDSKRPF
jgi:hypothetical protein